MTTPNQPQLALMRRYRCMYTKDIAKKHKTWHDGYIVYHHMNSKCLLFDTSMLQLDEVFHRARAPGIKGFSNVPSSFMFPADYQVDFDKHFATVEELTYEEQKDVAELFAKKAPIAVDTLDCLADDDDERQEASARRFAGQKRKAMDHDNQQDDPFTSRTPAIARLMKSTIPSSRTPLNERLNGTVAAHSQGCESPRAFTTPVLHSRTFPTPDSGPGSVRSSVGSAGQALHKVSTPFRMPTTLSGGSLRLCNNNNAQTPQSAPRRMLGTSRPTSSLARRSLQLDWAKFSEKTRQATEPKSTLYRSSTGGPVLSLPRSRESEQQRNARRANTLQQLQMEDEQIFIRVEEPQREITEGGASEWMFN